MTWSGHNKTRILPPCRELGAKKSMPWFTYWAGFSAAFNNSLVHKDPPRMFKSLNAILAS